MVFEPFKIEDLLASSSLPIAFQSFIQTKGTKAVDIQKLPPLFHLDRKFPAMFGTFMRSERFRARHDPVRFERF
jgi:hypothetical protein